MARRLLVDGEPVLTRREAMPLLGVRSASTLLKWERRGLIPAYAVTRTSRGTVYLAETVRALAEGAAGEGGEGR